jgi:phage-related protein
MSKDLKFIGSSLKDVREMPAGVREEFGFSLYLAQKGEKSVNAVPLVGFGSSKVLEIITSEENSTYRAVYTVKFEKAVYVLHCFQKKSKTDIKTPTRDKEIISRRLKAAEQDYAANYEIQREKSNGRRTRGR